MAPASLAHRLSRRSVRSIVLIGIAFAAAFGLLAQWQAAPIVRLDNLLLDTFVRTSASGRPARDTVVVDIDEVSLSAVGQWPWPRYRVAALIRRIAEGQPAAIALDIAFPEEDRSSLIAIQRAFKREFDVDLRFSGVPEGLTDNDGYLGHEIARADVVGASYLYFDHLSRVDAPSSTGLHFDGLTDRLALRQATGLMVNADAIASQTRVSGHINTQVDDDGVLRRLPLLIQHGGTIHAHLSLAAVMRSMGLSTGTIEADEHGLGIRLGRHRVPIDDAGYATLRFGGKPSLYPSIPAVQVLGENFRADDLRGKIVFIGTSAVGLNDLHFTAMDARFPGLKVQSVMAENILHDEFVRTPSWARASIVVACLAAGAAMAAIFVLGHSLLPLLAGSALVAAALLSASAALFAQAGLFVSAGAPLLVVAGLFIAFSVMRLAIERQRARVWLKQLENARQVTIESMASVAETRDPETGAHIKRTQNYVRAIAEELKRSGLHQQTLTREYIDLLFISAPLHDIGKVGVPDHILLKPGRLTPDEMEQMKQHAEFGRRVIHSTAQRIDGENFLSIAGDIAATHHEKWDGSGYPHGLAGTQIPLAGRIMAVADIYDALISRRCYKEPFPHPLATSMMKALRGETFDPDVLDAFFRIEDQIQDIAARFKDEAEGDTVKALRGSLQPA